jgi:cell division protein FtsI/penicillin-binding protein 2
MKQVKRRTWFSMLFVIALAAGLGLLLFRYAADGGKWAAFSANAHIYTDGKLTQGQIRDRNGEVLYDFETNEYSGDKTVRKATLHAVGDPGGNIATGARLRFRSRLCGFSPLTGTTAGGHRAYLTIDSKLNAAAYEALDGARGTVGVYDYTTGQILCMVSNPSFDPENPPSSVDGSRYEGVYMNRFLSSTYTPGSVFKVVTAAAAIENVDGIFDRKYTCTGSCEIGGKTITCPEAHGEEDMYGALANSCNCWFARLAAELGGKTMARYADKLGLLSSQDVSGISTAAGAYDAAPDGSADLGWSGIGQYDDLVNPCAMMTLMGTIANGGTKVAPQLFLRETDALGVPMSVYSAEKTDGAIKSATCAKLRDMLRSDVTEHYGQEKFGDLAVCAKSGTAEVGAGKTPHSWFTGFIDDEKHPLAFVVVVENGGGGAAVAGSVAAKVLAAAAKMGY